MSFLSSLFGSSESRLLDLMKRLAAGATPELEQEFFKTLLASSLRVPSPGVDSQGLPWGEGVAAAGTKLRVLGTTAPDGRRAMLAFTGEKALRVWRPVGCDSVEMKVSDACALALSAGMEAVLLDRGSPHCCALSGETLRDLAEGREPLAAGACRPEQVAPGTVIVFSKVSQTPPEVLVAALRDEAAAHGAILKAYLVAAAIGGEPPRPIVVLELAPGADLGAVVPPFVSGSTVRLGGRAIPDVLPLLDPSLLAAAREQGTLVYSR